MILSFLLLSSNTLQCFRKYIISDKKASISNHCSGKSTKVCRYQTVLKAKAGNRFWLERIPINDKNTSTTDNNEGTMVYSYDNVTSQYNYIRSTLFLKNINMEKINMGMIISPVKPQQTDPLNITSSVNNIDNKKRLIPIHNGLLQTQHTAYVSVNNDNEIVVCGFYPRASHNIISMNNENNEDEDDDNFSDIIPSSLTSSTSTSMRELDENRYNALNYALLYNYGINHTDILNNNNYDGTSILRTYRSFVYPKPYKQNIYLLESVEKAANRTATQIELCLRQYRADLATYLRNIDKEFNNNIDSHNNNNEEIVRANNSSNSNDNSSINRKVQPVIFILDNLRSAFNVGSIFRTSETGGVYQILTIGITPHGIENMKLRKTAFSALDVVPSLHFDNSLQAYDYVKSIGYTVVVMETTSKSLLYTNISYPEKVALVVGNELTGK